MKRRPVKRTAFLLTSWNAWGNYSVERFSRRFVCGGFRGQFAAGSRHCTSFGMGLLNLLCGSVTIQAVKPFTFFAGAFKGPDRFLV